MYFARATLPRPAGVVHPAPRLPSLHGVARAHNNTQTAMPSGKLVALPNGGVGGYGDGFKVRVRRYLNRTWGAAKQVVRIRVHARAPRSSRRVVASKSSHGPPGRPCENGEADDDDHDVGNPRGTLWPRCRRRGKARATKRTGVGTRVRSVHLATQRGHNFRADARTRRGLA